MSQPSPQPHFGLRQPALSIGTIVGGRYQILRVLGAGGMGRVYLAQNTSIGQKVAIKVLESHFFHHPTQIQRFMREARAICKIHHENVIYLSDFGYTDAQIPFIVMEYLEGEDLLHTLKREGSLPWSQALGIMRQICAGLEAAHYCGVVHRDLKPSNCFRIVRSGQEDWIKLIDFGIAKLRDESQSGLTQTGIVMGTPAYMSPEQASGDDIDLRSDLYSAAVILYHLLCGRLPFVGERAMDVVHKHIAVAPPSLSEATPHRQFHPHLEVVMAKALAKRPEERFQSAKELFAALAEVDEIAKRACQPVASDRIPLEITSPELVEIEKPVHRPLNRPVLGFLGGLGIVGAITLSLWGVHGIWPSNQDVMPLEGLRNLRILFQEAVKPVLSKIKFEEQIPLEQKEQVFIQHESQALLVAGNGSSSLQSLLESSDEQKQPKLKQTVKKVIPHRSTQSLQHSLKRITPQVQACLAQGGFPGQVVSVEVRVAADGTLEQVTVLGPLSGSALGICVKKAVGQAKFVRGEKGDVVSYKFKL